MSEVATTGSIYDLGYRRYDGVRLGRRHAVFALYIHGLRTCFGLGRRASSKVFPFGLGLLVFVPAAIQLGIAAIASNVVEVFQHEDYYGFIEVILALWVSAVAPELVGRDQRSHTLSLYFSRAISRTDYAAARFAALATAVFALTFLPQAVLFVGNGLAENDFGGYIRDDWDQVAPILASAAVISLFMSGLALAIAAQTPRRVYATVSILAAFIVPWIVASILVEETDGDFGPAMFASPFHIIRGLAFWIFRAPPGVDDHIARADLPGALYGAAAMAVTMIATWILWRRLQRLSA